MFSETRKNELAEKLKNTQAKHVVFSLLVTFGGIFLLVFVKHFPNCDFASIGMIWFLIVGVLGFIFR